MNELDKMKIKAFNLSRDIAVLQEKYRAILNNINKLESYNKNIKKDSKPEETEGN